MKATARWSIELLTICPHCETWVDLLEWDEFWSVVRVNPCEHGTERTKCVDVTCPKCEETFDVELVY